MSARDLAAQKCLRACCVAQDFAAEHPEESEAAQKRLAPSATIAVTPERAKAITSIAAFASAFQRPEYRSLYEMQIEMSAALKGGSNAE